jgi:hypothetical protein
MRIALAALLMTGLVALAYRPQRDPMPQFPRIMLWAWERPEKLDFINPREIGVAFLARTIQIHGGLVTVRPRLQPLLVAPGTAIMAVVRIESQDALYSTHREVEHAILEATDFPGVQALQLDYDAKASERDFYRTVLTDLRNVLPPGMPLSMTALASWCESDDWISDLPVAEAVPMLFRMGAEPYRGNDFRPAACRSSVGISTDEPLPRRSPGVSRGRRVYIFNTRSWSRGALRAAVAEVQRWQ